MISGTGWLTGWRVGTADQMSVVMDIFASYARPGEVAARRTGDVPREDRALAVLMAACFLMFIAQWPALSRTAFEDSTIDLRHLIGAALFGWLFVMPIVMYLFGAVGHLLARLLGGRGSWYSARFVLFWALLASTPLWLLNGLIAGMIGPSPALTATSLLASAAFFWFWFAGLRRVEWRQHALGGTP